MVVNFEFLNDDPIENVISCMNYKFDKVVFFGYHDVIVRQHERTEKFLKEQCQVQRVVFHPLSQKDLQSTLNTMRSEIQAEHVNKNQVYFDITGGESLILVAFGMLASEYDTPMYMYDILDDKIIELEDGSDARISTDLEPRKIPMTLDLMVKMHGGIINERLQKNIKLVTDPEFMQDIDRIYQIAKRNWTYWNYFSDFLRNTMVPVTELKVSKLMQTVRTTLENSNQKLNTLSKFNEIIDALADAGILLHVEHSGSYYRFEFKNQELKDCLWEGGSILELHTCQEEAKNSDECQIGIHLDWDGIIHDEAGVDVLNEIDVLSLNGNIPTFISCKSGSLSGQHALRALYELETVANRFGGKYAKKILVTARGLGDVYVERAKAMGIEVK